jgi:phenylpropionate dioxygenase-like ring-hydroxylating dioxygenase large terminal subunit
MKFIATDIEDNSQKFEAAIASQNNHSGYAMPSYFYRSHIGYERELDRLIFKSWLFAGHISQIPQSGDYFLFEVGEDCIIVSRDSTGSIHALQNICRHRGSRVCEQSQGNSKTFVCPYHGWVYNNDGTIRSARHMESKEDFDPKAHGLRHAQIIVFEGLIFINFDPSAADFSPVLDRIGVTLKPNDLPNAKLAHRKIYQVDANWKLVLENYLECYHCATSHRAYAKRHSLKDPEAGVSELNSRMLQGAEAITGIKDIAHDHYESYSHEKIFGTSVYTSRYALYDGFVTGSKSGEPLAPLMGNIQGFDGGCCDLQLGPLTFMLNYPDHCVLYRFTPRSLTSTDMELFWFVRGDATEGVDYDEEALIWLWCKTTAEDEYIISRNSEGVNSRFFEPGPYHPEFERCCIDFVEWYLAAMA